MATHDPLAPKARKEFFYKNSKAKRRSKSVDSLLRFLLRHALCRLRAKFSKYAGPQNGSGFRPAPRAEVAFLLRTTKENTFSREARRKFFGFSRKARKTIFLQKLETETALKKCRFFTTFLTSASTFSASGKIFEKAGQPNRYPRSAGA